MLCGDARSSDDLGKVLEGEKVDIIFTDPPYSVPNDGHVCGLGKIRHREFAMAAGEMSRVQFVDF